MKILGIETSCDETAAAVVEIDDALNCTLLSNMVASSMDLHVQYGGVVPEIAARSHIESIIPVVDRALRESLGTRVKSQDISNPWEEIEGIAVTHGAGLGGSLLVGVMTARTLAITKNKPLYAINHVEGHVYANFITKQAAPPRRQERGVGSEEKDKISAPSSLPTPHYSLPAAAPQFPMLALIVSGGHSQLVLFRGHFDYTLLGRTQDDAIGEAFDKVAKMIGLPYPGGPSIGALAPSGDPFAFQLPKAQMTSISPALAGLRREEWGVGSRERLQNSPVSALPSPHSASKASYDFSFSGLKTAALRKAQELIGEDFTFPSKDLPERLPEAQKADMAAVFQRVAIETVVDKTIQAYEEFSPASVVIAGGVAASPELRHQLEERLSQVIEHSQDLRLDAQQGTAEESQQAVQSGTVSEHRRPVTQLGAKNSGGVVGSADKSAAVAQILRYQDPKLCTDNGAMIATLGAFKLKLGQPTADPYSLEIQPNLSM